MGVNTLNFAAWSRLAFAGLKEIRILYKGSFLDVDAMDRDLEIEWNRLYQGDITLISNKY